MRSVAELLPHQPPMRLIEHVLAHDAEQVWAMSTIERRFPFASEHGVRACFGLEMIAQSAAALLTLIGDRLAPGAPPRQGMLIASRRFDSRVSHYPLDSCLLIHAKLASRLPSDAAGSGLVKFDGSVAVFQDAAAVPTSIEALAVLDASNVDTRVSLSVYV